MLQITLFVLLALSLTVQYEVVFPLEAYLLPASGASILYLPHGLKAIAVVLAGYRALLPIFSAHLLAYIIWSVPTPSIVLDAAVSTLVMFIPLVVWNFNRMSSLFSAIPIADESKVALFRLVMAVSFVATLFNALLHTLIFTEESIGWLSFRFIVGDLLGTVVVLSLLLMLKSTLVKRLKIGS